MLTGIGKRPEKPSRPPTSNVALLADEPDIRDVISFPKTKRAAARSGAIKDLSAGFVPDQAQSPGSAAFPQPTQGASRFLLVPAGADDQPVVAHHPGVFDSSLAGGGVEEDVVHPAPGLGDLQLRKPFPVNGVA